ncbi:MAG: ATP synthase F0 subunit B [Ignavibacteriales bacterium CG07_land_8_20_14_0_80_59_12]|nr:MAG: ATP synthase F0 subunit B [Ignavibacteriales bacterium CG07_land_8_20_14_0_80_59_12]
MLLELNPGLLIWTGITFLLVLLILSKFAWKPLIRALSKREETIRLSIERAEEAKAEAERLLAEHAKRLASTQEETARLIRDARADAETMKNDIVEKANANARRMLDAAKEEIDRKTEQAIGQLRGEVAGLAIKAAEKILEETLDESRQRALVEKFLNELPKN